jgi:hypothetical protein
MDVNPVIKKTVNINRREGALSFPSPASCSDEVASGV